MTRFFHSTTPFYWGVIGTENSWAIPTSLQNCSNWEFSKSFPWSLRRWFMHTPFSFYNLLYKISICWGASNLDLSKIAHVNLVKSSSRTIIYLLPPRDFVWMWKSSRGLDVVVVNVAWWWVLVCFPSWHGPHTILSTLAIWGMPSTTSFLDMIDSCLYLACHILWCHNSSLCIRILLQTISAFGAKP